MNFEKIYKENGQEKLELKQEGEKIYLKEFFDKLESVLNHEFGSKKGEKIILQEIINEGLDKIDDNGDNFEEKKQFIKSLTEIISNIPVNSWAINFSEAIKKNGSNCSNSSSLMGLILEKLRDKLEIKNIEYAFPAGHAVNVVAFNDDSVYFLDSRNNIFIDSKIGEKTIIEDRKGLKIYNLVGFDKAEYKIIPALPLKDGILSAYLGNLNSAFKTAKGEVPGLKRIESEEYQKNFIKGAKEICEKMDLSNETVEHFIEVAGVFDGKLKDFQESDEFRSEYEEVVKKQAAKNL